MYKVVWDNGISATGEFPYVFGTWEEANDYGKDWARAMQVAASNVRDGLLELDDSERYSYDVVERREQRMTMHLTTNEIIDLIDCVDNRIADLEDVAVYGDVETAKTLIDPLNNLLNKLQKTLETDNA